MTAPDETTFKLVEWAWAGVLALGGMVWRAQDAKIDKIAQETERNRDVSAKIFDKLDDMSKDSHDRHDRLLTALHDGLSRKADK